LGAQEEFDQKMDRFGEIKNLNSIKSLSQATKILSPEQVRQADAFTIGHEPVSSLDLMERASGACTDWILDNVAQAPHFKVFCGVGNNGGDGLAISRLLKQQGCHVKVYIVRHSEHVSADFRHNEQRLKRIYEEDIADIREAGELPDFDPGDVIIDALFGTGLSRPVEGLAAECIRHINQSKARVISIDMPSGLNADRHTPAPEAVVHATDTLSFQCPKLAFMFAENSARTGKWHILDIGLSRAFIENAVSDKFFLTRGFISGLIKSRDKFSHKGSYGHALLVVGKYGSMGAAVLAARACLRSGVGLLTVHVPSKGVDIMHVSAPEALVSVDGDPEQFSTCPDLSAFTAIGIGPGVGTVDKTKGAFTALLERKPLCMMLDADALNMMGMDRSLLGKMPGHSVLTPHPKEFERLAGKAGDDFERHRMQLELSAKYQACILLKGAHSCLTTPGGISYFNSTGNPGMARGGSGDVLSGIITGLLAQGYSSGDSSLIGMYVHGMAGDIAMKRLGVTGMVAGDIVDALPEAWMELAK
jgi:hydroxyethylthiazole kinase-like uncharacterized protein yjeF